MIERTVVIFKPDAVKRGLVGEILSRFEEAGLKVLALKMLISPRKLCEEHYPGTEDWLTKVGEKTLVDFRKYKADPMEVFGTLNPVVIGKKVREWNIKFLSSGRVVAAILEGEDGVRKVRQLVGSTIPADAKKGTIRGDLSRETAVMANRGRRAIRNLVHASGNLEEAEAELKLWFKDHELV